MLGQVKGWARVCLGFNITYYCFASVFEYLLILPGMSTGVIMIRPLFEWYLLFYCVTLGRLASMFPIYKMTIIMFAINHSWGY